MYTLSEQALICQSSRNHCVEHDVASIGVKLAQYVLSTLNIKPHRNLRYD